MGLVYRGREEPDGNENHSETTAAELLSRTKHTAAYSARRRTAHDDGVQHTTTPLRPSACTHRTSYKHTTAHTAHHRLRPQVRHAAPATPAQTKEAAVTCGAAARSGRGHPHTGRRRRRRPCLRPPPNVSLRSILDSRVSFQRSTTVLMRWDLAARPLRCMVSGHSFFF
ncbi:LAFE_0D05094g1_1 [Lachancea fermentati]|uniref:LAFE_0D05094g1_1 n=1 Tax=Lachancea fermentati TaxID=4955 RepID=A0A1G4MB69_LACFM|nr:LAFE_0D05094g1_1 [Lachancea fermentati]